MKFCRSCGLEKELSNFTKNNRNKDLLENNCKECRSLKMKKDYHLNKDKINEHRREKYESNKDDINKFRREKYHLNKDEILQYQKKYKENNPEYNQKYKDYQKEYHKSEKFKNYKIKNSDKLKEYDKEYRSRKDIKERVSKQSTERNRIRKAEDPLFKLKISIRSSLSNNFRCNGFKKSLKTENVIGCSFEEFKIYLEEKFEDWMTWENKGLYNGEFNYGWDIDHIIPLSTAITEDDIIRLNHHTNLQPLCSKINREIKR